MHSILRWLVLINSLFSINIFAHAFQRSDDQEPGIHYLKYYEDMGNSDIEEIIGRPFEDYFSTTPLKLKRQTSIWVKFQLVNPLEEQYWGFLYYPLLNPHNQLLTLSLYDDRYHLLAKGGSWVAKSELPLEENRFCLPVFADSHDSVEYLLQIFSLVGGSLPPLEFQLLSRDESMKMEIWNGRTATEDYIHEGSFWGILFLCMILTGFQFYFYKDRSYIFYFLYVAVISIYYLRNIQGPLGDIFSVNADYGKYLYSTETSLQYLIFGLYIFFIFHFLELNKTGRSQNLVLTFKIAGLFFLGMVVFDQVIWLGFGVFASRDVYNIIRFLFFPIAGITLIYLLRHRKEVSNLFILTGTLFLIIPSIFTFFEQMADGPYGHRVKGGLLREFHLQKLDISLFMYNTRIGVILEIICFTLGLTYKNREEIRKARQIQEEAREKRREKFSNPFLRDVDSIIEKYLGDDQLNPTRLARYLGVAESTLNRKLNTLKGKSTSNYIRAQKMKKAATLLLNSSMPISEISSKVGIFDLSYFSRSFKQEFGVSPSAYRKGLISDE